MAQQQQDNKGVVLILGAGTLASYLPAFLVPRFHVRVLAHDHKKDDAFKQQGAEVVIGDVKDFEVVKNALSGVHTVISTLADRGHVEFLEIQNKIVDLSVTAGSVTHFIPSVFTLHPFDDVTTDFLLSIEAGVEKVKSSGLNWTAFYVGCVIESWTRTEAGFDAEHGDVYIKGDGENVVPWISHKDLAQVVALSVGNHKVYNKTVDVASENMSFNKLVSVFARERGRKFQSTYTTAAALKAAVKEAPEPGKTRAAVFYRVANAQPFRLDHLKDIFPDFKPTTTLVEHAIEQSILISCKHKQ